MQTNTLVFEKFTRTNKPSLAADSTRQCKKAIKLARKAARCNKRFDYSAQQGV